MRTMTFLESRDDREAAWSVAWDYANEIKHLGLPHKIAVEPMKLSREDKTFGIYLVSNS